MITYIGSNYCSNKAFHELLKCMLGKYSCVDLVINKCTRPMKYFIVLTYWKRWRCSVMLSCSLSVLIKFLIGKITDTCCVYLFIVHCLFPCWLRSYSYFVVRRRVVSVAWHYGRFMTFICSRILICRLPFCVHINCNTNPY